MRNIKKYEIKIDGETPVIFNRMKKENEDEKKKLRKDELSEWEEKNWLKKAEFNGNSTVVMPTEWIKSMLLNACKQTKMVPHFATTKKATYTRYFQSVLIPPKPPILLGKKKELVPHGGYYPAQGTRKTGGKVWKVFPKMEKWSVTFNLVDPFGRMKKAELKELIEYGGMFIGLGDQRAMNFGRFDIDYVKEIKE